MRPAYLITLCTLLSQSGCATLAPGIRYGTPITHVQMDYGMPDVISDVSGSDGRFYVPADRPEYEWPADAPRTFYYLDRGLAITFVSGKAVSAEKIDPETREIFLLPSMQSARRRAATRPSALHAPIEVQYDRSHPFAPPPPELIARATAIVNDSREVRELFGKLSWSGSTLTVNSASTIKNIVFPTVGSALTENHLLMADSMGILRLKSESSAEMVAQWSMSNRKLFIESLSVEDASAKRKVIIVPAVRQAE